MCKCNVHRYIGEDEEEEEDELGWLVTSDNSEVLTPVGPYNLNAVDA
jgi:hypothetical protein